MLILIRGAGDLASGVALRLHRSGLKVVMTDLERPTAIRRTVCFSQTILFGKAKVEDVTAVRAETMDDVRRILAAGNIPVLADPAADCRHGLRPDVLVDAILAKKNLGTKIDDAPLVIALGPGFSAGEDCHAVIETMRGHTLGRVIYRGSAIPNTNIPGLIGGFAGERVLRAPADGVFHRKLEIGARVEPGDVAGEAAGLPDRRRPARDSSGGNAGSQGHEIRRRRPARTGGKLLYRVGQGSCRRRRRFRGDSAPVRDIEEGSMMENQVKLTKLAQCAGCGAKVGAGTLAQLLEGIRVHSDPNLLVGFDKSDDASVYRVSDELALVQTVDFFPPIADDPYTFGQIAATNALSDVYAMGGEPKLALNIMCLADKMDDHTVREILRGGYDKAYEAGAIITGGHTIHGAEPIYGLAVSGFVDPRRILTNSGARPGDVLLLTKPLGVGVLTTAAKAGLAGGAVMDRIYRQMATLNRTARDIMVKYRVHSCTDVTGFALLGHSFEMAQGSGCTVHIQSGNVPFHPEAWDLAAMGLIPAGAYRNRDFAQKGVTVRGDVSRTMQDLLYDPQTSGGLLIALPETAARDCLAQLRDAIPSAACIGYVTAREDSWIVLE